MHEDNKIAMLREHLAILSKSMDDSLECAEESYSNLAEDASRLFEACLWAGHTAWDKAHIIPDIMSQVCSERKTVAQAMSAGGYAPMKDAVHVRYYFDDGKFFCEGCQRNVEVGCKDGCSMIPKLGIAHE